MSEIDRSAFVSNEVRWEALRDVGGEAAAPEGWEPDEGEGGFEKAPNGV